MLKVNPTIESMHLNNEQLIFSFSGFWYQEDIEQLLQQILANSSKISILETIKGADRENTRFVWHDKFYFALNFDCYSQSCWLEGEDEMSSKQLKQLMEALNIL